MKESQLGEKFTAYKSERGDKEDGADLIIINALVEDFFTSFENEINCAVSLLYEMDKPFWEPNKYMEIKMPGRIIASNG